MKFYAKCFALVLCLLCQSVTVEVGAKDWSLNSIEESLLNGKPGPWHNLKPLIDNAHYPEKTELLSLLSDALSDYLSSVPNCSNGKIRKIKSSEFALMDPLVAKAIKDQKWKSAWFIRAKIKACKLPSTMRFLLAQTIDDGFKAMVLFPGSSHVWGALLKDLRPSLEAASAITMIENGIKCAEKPSIQIIDTRAKKDALKTFGIVYFGSWQETWKVRACGRIFKMPINFKATGNGGAFFGFKQISVKLISG